MSDQNQDQNSEQSNESFFSFLYYRISDNLASIEQGIIFSQFFGVLFSLSAIAFQVVIVSILIRITRLFESLHLVTAPLNVNPIQFKIVLFSQSQGEQQFFFIGPTVVILSQLFLYCYFGQRITDQVRYFLYPEHIPSIAEIYYNFQSCRLSESIYQLNWYNYPIKFQKYFQLMMLRSQNSKYFSGFGFVYCSLRKFMDVTCLMITIALNFSIQYLHIQILKFVGSVVALFRNLQA